MLRHLIRTCVPIAILAVSLMSQARGAEPREPKYVVLQRSQKVQQPVPSARSGYAYGWFGAKPVRHVKRHFGYYERFRQLSWQ